MGPSVRWDDGGVVDQRRCVIPAHAGIHRLCEPRCSMKEQGGSQLLLGRRRSRWFDCAPHSSGFQQTHVWSRWNPLPVRAALLDGGAKWVPAFAGTTAE